MRNSVSISNPPTPPPPTQVSFLLIYQTQPSFQEVGSIPKESHSYFVMAPAGRTWHRKAGAQLQLNTSTSVRKSQPLSCFLGCISWKDAKKIPKGAFGDLSSPVDEEKQKVFDGKTEHGNGKMSVVYRALTSTLHERIWRILVASFPN